MRPRQVKNRLNARQRLVVVLMDVALLTELTVCMYRGAADPTTMAAEFLRLYVPLLLVTVVGARLLMRRFRSSETDTDTVTAAPAAVDAGGA